MNSDDERFKRPPPILYGDLARCCVCEATIKRMDAVIINGYLCCSRFECVGAILRRTEPAPPLT